MTINCIVIDDEPLARKGLVEYIDDIGYLHCTGEFESPMQASKHIGSTAVQLIYLDIQMPKISGIDFLKTLVHPPPVIFTTAFPQYALDGFDLNALDYLVKPISFERFLTAANKAKEYYELRQKNGTDNIDPAHLFVKVDGRLVKINFDDILFVEALQNYVAIHTHTGKKHISYITLQTIAEFLPSSRFVKTHKSFIVALNKVESIDGNILQVGSHHVPISRSLKEAVLEKLLGTGFLRR
jgi:DNA-binding LytR/AlgR family response regulator